MALELKPGWWRDKVGYQIYPLSFCDSDGDGVGDIPGIVSKLDYLADLGVGFIWLSPVYRSPMKDNGYDISDYRDIAPEFGTLADMDRLIVEAAARDIGIVMDLVVNHTSDRHEWFVEARKSRDARTRDWYVWRDPAPGGGPPEDRQSYFGGPAWRFSPETGQYYLALFTPEQPDLNWDNPDLRAEIFAMMRWWLDRGVAGFRMDVIDHIGKDVDAGVVTDGPRLHDHLRQMYREVLAGRNVLTVGEAWSATTETALLYTGRGRGELDMMFQFAHVTAHWDDVHGKWKPRPFHLPRLKTVLNAWQAALADDGWNALFWSNHDLPRAVSAYGDPGRYRERSAKMLATVLHLMKGTPYVYQGEELGMTNGRFDSIDDLRDVETLTHYYEAKAAGLSQDAFLNGVNTNGRDTARTPMQWTDGPNAGFTEGDPWLPVNPNHQAINAKAALADPGSVLAHYRKLIVLRRTHEVIVSGRYMPHLPDHPSVMAYTRTLDGACLAVIGNFTAGHVDVDVPEQMAVTGEPMIWNDKPRDRLAGHVRLEPYEAAAVLSNGNGRP